MGLLIHSSHTSICAKSVETKLCQSEIAKKAESPGCKLEFRGGFNRVSIGLPVSSLPGIHLTFDTQLIGKPEPGLLSRFEERSAGALPLLRDILTRSTVLRKGKKYIAGIIFEELLVKTSTEEKDVYAFRLEFPGSPNSSMEPYTVLELSTVDSGPGFEDDEEAIAFWDKLVASLSRI